MKRRDTPWPCSLSAIWGKLGARSHNGWLGHSDSTQSYIIKHIQLYADNSAYRAIPLIGPRHLYRIPVPVNNDLILTVAVHNHHSKDVCFLQKEESWRRGMTFPLESEDELQIEWLITTLSWYRSIAVTVIRHRPLQSRVSDASLTLFLGRR